MNVIVFLVIIEEEITVNVLNNVTNMVTVYCSVVLKMSNLVVVLLSILTMLKNLLVKKNIQNVMELTMKDSSSVILHQYGNISSAQML